MGVLNNRTELEGASSHLLSQNKSHLCPLIALFIDFSELLVMLMTTQMTVKFWMKVFGLP